MRNLFEYKFIIPPVVCIIAIVLVFPDFFLRLASKETVAEILFGGTLVILAFGFLLSTITYFLLNWIEEDLVAEKEWEYWGKLEGDNMRFRRDNIVKRWDMAVLNFNTALGLSLVILFVVFFKCGVEIRQVNQDFLSTWLIICLLLTVFTLLNGLKARRDVHYFTKVAQQSPSNKTGV